MYGQWIGRYQGTNAGSVTMDIDDHEADFRGIAYVFDDDMRSPFYTVRFRTKDKADVTTSIAEVGFIDRQNGKFLSRDHVVSQYPDMNFPHQAIMKFAVQENTLNVDWHTDVGTNGKASLPRSQADLPSEISPEIEGDWDTFRSSALNGTPGRFIFRGQSNGYRLRTSFHRTKRKDLIKYVEMDIPTLHRSLSPRTKHLFKLQDGNDNGAFWNLLQHHGYPTPLLDWSYSP